MKSTICKLAYQTSLVFFLVPGITTGSQSAFAQFLVPDNTLGTQVNNINLSTTQINGGLTKGSNLFHSFSQFNILPGQTVNFLNPTGITNILTRVTGGNPSQIFGTLGVNGTANLYLINPNGIYFGNTAQLNIAGSFTATTADSIKLGENGLFSAKDPQSSNLLNVQPSALFKNALTNQLAGIKNDGNLTVGQNLTLFSSNVYNTGTLTAPGITQLTGANILLANGNFNTGTLFLDTKDLAIADNATISQSTLEGLPGNTNLILQASNNLAISSLANNTLNLLPGTGKITFTGNGNFQMYPTNIIKTNGRDINITAGSFQPLGNIDSSFYQTVFNNNYPLTSGAINLKTTNGDLNVVNLNALSYTGNSGEVNLNSAGNITLYGDIYAANNVNLNANNNIVTGIIVSSGSPINIISANDSIENIRGGIYSNSNSERPAGDILLQAGKDIKVTNQITAGSLKGGGGKITLKSGNSILVNQYISSATNFCINAGVCGTNSAIGGDIYLKSPLISINHGITSTIEGLGTGGNIIIEAQKLNINDNSITSSTNGIGNGGNVRVTADEVNIIKFPTSTHPFGVGLTSLTTGLGNAGNINLTTNKLLIQNNSQTASSGFDRAGINTFVQPNIAAKYRNLTFAPDAFQTGQGGNITINASEIKMIGNQPQITPFALNIEQAKLSMNIATGITTGTFGSGKAGNLNINTNNLTMENGAGMFTGSVAPKFIYTLFPNYINLAVTEAFNQSSILQFFYTPAQLTNKVVNDLSKFNDAGNGGNLEVNANQITLQKSSALGTVTFSSGSSGNLITKAEQIKLQDASIMSVSSLGTGNAGNLSITANNLAINNFSTVAAGTTNNGFGGNINIDVNDLQLNSGGQILANATVGSTGNAGNINILANNSINVLGGNSNQVNNTGLFALTEGRGNAGKLQINVDKNPVNLIKLDQGIFTVQATASGNSGNVDINAKELNLNKSQISASTNSGTGDNINLQNLETLTVGNNSNISTTTNTGKAGSININKNQTPVNYLTLNNNSLLSAEANGKNGEAGSLTINSKQLNLDIGEISASNISGKVGGDINLQNLETLTLNNSKIAASTVDGQAGNIQINQNQTPVDTISLYQSIVPVEATGTGDAGNIIINSKKVNLEQSQISASTKSGIGQNINFENLDKLIVSTSKISASTVDGKAGDINITAKELMQFYGEERISVEATGTGSAGNITINTPELNIGNSAVISASNVDGLGGNINITANKFTANNGSKIVSSTSGKAKAGNIVMKVKDNITLDGEKTGLFANTQIGSSGDSGSIDIDPEIFIIRNGAGIGVNSQGSGKGGNINITAGTLTLDNQAFITAETINNEGGEITLNINDLLWLRNNSNITATAGTAGAGGNGGNVNINVPFIINFASENSDITANAFQGNGGNINITTNTIFGLKFQPKQTEFSDITASSQFGLSGQVTINRLDVDPSRGLVSLPTNLVDASNQLAQSCNSNGGKVARQQSRFSIIGKGGLPSHPDDIFTGTSPMVELVDISTTKISQNDNKPVVINHQNNQKVNLKNREIQQAQGWVFTNDGRVILTSQTSQAIPQNTSLNNPGCEVFSQ